MSAVKTPVPARTALAAAALAALSLPVAAANFEFGDGWSGNWVSTASVGTSWRAQDRDSRLYSVANGKYLGLTDGTGNNTIDQGTLNYDKGDRFTTLFKLISEVSVKKGEFGALVRAKAWYDHTLKNEDVRFGSQNNGYNNYDPGTDSLGAAKPLSDRGFERLNKFSGISLLDAYVYNSFELAGRDLQVRVGNQTLNWGESLFIQGINQINPIDVPAFRKPGAQIKEVLIPVPILSASLSLGSAGSLEAFLQMKWQATPIDAGCGNYWTVAEASISSTGGSCDGQTPIGSSPAANAADTWAFRNTGGTKPVNSGQFGVAYRFNSDALDTEFGLYAMKIHSRTPNINLYFPQTGKAGTSLVSAANWDYAEDIKIFGLTASTNIGGWSVAGELSHQRDVPVQTDGNDLLFGAFGFGPLAAQVAAAASGSGFYQGYERFNKTQLQVNTIKAGSASWAGAGLYLLVAEVGMQWNNVPDYKNDPAAKRFGRNFIFGPGSHPAYGGNTCGTFNVNQEGCANDGYVSRFSSGIRMLGELQYQNVMNSGVLVAPSLFYSRDLSGYSMDGQFLKGRQAVGLGVRFNYAKKYTLQLSATTFSNAKFDPLRDRDFFSANLAYDF
jgi:Protein of unknown function (DUF1302)